MPKTPFVIAISGPSGAGKSTLIKNLVGLFDDAVSLSIDDYPNDHYPPAMGWLVPMNLKRQDSLPMFAL